MSILSSSLSNVSGFKDIHIVEARSEIHDDPIEALALFFEANFDVDKAIALGRMRQRESERIKTRGKIRQLSKKIKILNNLGSIEAWKEKQECIQKRKQLIKTL